MSPQSPLVLPPATKASELLQRLLATIDARPVGPETPKQAMDRHTIAARTALGPTATKREVVARALQTALDEEARAAAEPKG
jgi:hypothetical protein